MDANKTARQVALTNCYECREVLKQAGGKWDAGRKAWILTEEQFNAADAVIEAGRNGGKAKRAIAAAWDNASGVWSTVTATETDPALAELAKFAAQVRRTGLTHGRDADVAECVRLGLLTENHALNTDD